MHLATELVIRAGQTFRGAARALALIAEHCWPPLATPCPNTIHSWLLRLGHYQLHRPLPKAEDWAWFIDLTLTIGPHKVLVIAAIRLREIPFAERSLAPTDLQLLQVAILERSTHETILPVLKTAQERTGPPRVIVTDEGSDLAKAVRRFRHRQPPLAHILDLAHIGANRLKRRFTAQPRWAEFLHQLTHTNQRIRQTELAYLLSPRLRDKGRFMSVGVVLRFARRVLYLLDRQLATVGTVQDYGWLQDYRVELQQWSLEQQVVQRTIEYVRDYGWHEGTLRGLEGLWTAMAAESSCEPLIRSLREFALEMVRQVHSEEILPGSTEVLESCFGQWKRLVEAGPSVGVSALVLALGSVMKPIPAEECQSAFEETPMKRVWKWLKTHVGETLQKLRIAFQATTKPAVT